jgi:hypothetical protein
VLEREPKEGGGRVKKEGRRQRVGKRKPAGNKEADLRLKRDREAVVTSK